MKTKYKILIALFSAVFVFSGVMIFREKSLVTNAEDEYKELNDIFVAEETVGGARSETTRPGNSETDENGDTARVPNRRIELSELKKINPDAVGWIMIPDTLISYPIVQGDTDYYLKHTFKGAYSNAGSIILELANSADMSDSHLIIYGHNMYSYGMFTELSNYTEYDFWSDHQYVYIWNESGQHTYRIFSAYTAYDNDAAYSVGYGHDDGLQRLADYMINNSRYRTNVTVTRQDNILTLSTCYNNENIRYLVNAVEVK